MEAGAVGDPKSNPVHYPADRRFYAWAWPPLLFVVVAVALLPLLAAWVQRALFGLPRLPEAAPAGAPLAFPGWLRLAHYLNFLFLTLLVRSGLSVLMDHPRLYTSDDCVPGTEWLRLTPVAVPTARVWTAKEDARYISPWFALPGYRHTIGVARHWHFLPALFWFLNGLVYVCLLFACGQWTRLVPTTWRILPDAWATFVNYANLRIPASELGVLYRYNPLQQLAYFGVVFVLAPLSFLAGMAMSPSIVARFPWYPRLFGGRQMARSLHFGLMVSYVVFLAIHVSTVFATGLGRNLNGIVLGVRGPGWLGLYVALAGIVSVALACALAHWLAWRHPRVSQYLVRRVHNHFMRPLFFGHLTPRAAYSKSDISPYFWPNGKAPESEKWRALEAGGFKDFRLKVGGLVDNPVELSLDDLRALGKSEQITMHHCIQGWSGIAQWGGLSMACLVELVRPRPEARVCVFESFGEGLYGGPYYDTQRLSNVLHGQCLLAYEMNGEPLSPVYGAPLRLRVENQLGYKMVKWIKSIEFVASEKTVGKGHGGKNEDDEYFDLIPDI